MPMKAIVDYDYKAEASDELSLKVGDVILDIIQVEDGWCKGNLNGKVGMFPDNFVTIQPEVKSPSPKPTKTEVKRKVKVIFAYDPANQDELKLTVGDVIEVLLDEEEGWARGLLKGAEGVFPTNFTEPMKTAPLPEVPTVASPTEPPKVSSPTTMLPADNAAPTSGTKKIKGGVGLGNIFDGPIKLRTSNSKTDLHDKSKMNEKRLSSTKVDPPPQTQQKIESTPIMPIHPIMNAIPKHPEHPPLVPKAEPAVTTKRYKVMFDYQAENEDELTLKKGEIVNVDNMNLADVGWWSGNIKDQDGSVRYGVFPDNFVAPAPMDEPEKPKQVVLDSKAAKAKIDAVLDSGKSSTKVMAPSAQPLLTAGSSMKRQAPKAPAPPLQSNKPPVETEPKKTATVVDDSSSTKLEDELPVTEESKLTHFKRAAGPKNRKKPDANNRREKANEANAAAEISMTTPSSPPPSSTTTPPSAAVRSHDPVSEPTTNGTSTPPPVESPTTVVPSKRDHKRGGIQVMPVMPGHTGGGDASTDRPSWMKNLKSRKSEKKTNPPPSVAPAAAKEETNKPPWLAHLKKTKVQPPKSTASPAPPAPTPKPAVPTPPTSHARTSSTSITESDKPSIPSSEVVEKTPSVAASKARLEPEMKNTSEEAGSLFDNDPPQRKVTTRPSEIKKSAAGPRPVSMTLPMSNKFGDFGAKKSATINKPRPPPLTSKPTLPANKPSSQQPNHSITNSSSSSALDELKEEMKLMKEQMHKMQQEQKQETQRLQKELEEERSKRVSLQGEVNQLKKLLHK